MAAVIDEVVKRLLIGAAFGCLILYAALFYNIFWQDRFRKKRSKENHCQHHHKPWGKDMPSYLLTDQNVMLAGFFIFIVWRVVSLRRRAARLRQKNKPAWYNWAVRRPSIGTDGVATPGRKTWSRKLSWFEQSGHYAASTGTGISAPSGTAKAAEQRRTTLRRDFMGDRLALVLFPFIDCPTLVSYNKAMSLGTYLNEFLEHLEIERNRSRATVQNYRFYLTRFLNWAGTQKISEPKNVTAELVRQYRLWLNRQTDAKGEPLKKNTQNYHLIALRSFLKYLAKRDVNTLTPEKIELMKMPQRQVEFLENFEVKRLLEAPNNINEAEVIKKRDLAILETLFSTGLRVSELANLKIDSVNLHNTRDGVGEFTVRGKGSKLRVVFLSESAKQKIKNYLDKRHDPSPYLFVRHDRAMKKSVSEKSKREGGSPLTPRSIQRLVQHYAKAAGLAKKVSPHTLRHSYATDLLKNGADIRSVQSLLGHSSITTTQVYTHLTDKQLREVHKNFHDKT
jgi:site-specific recombinase XerD